MDGGDLFFSQPKLDGKALAREQLRARAIVYAYNQLSTEVMTIGENDLTGGLDFLLELADSANFPIISANLTDANGGHPLPPNTIIERDGLNWGFIGVSTQQGDDPAIAFSDPVVAVQRQVEVLRTQVDFLTVLFHGGQERLAELQTIQGVDLIIQSHLNILKRDLGSGVIPVANLGNQGKYVCNIHVNLDEPGKKIKDISKLRSTLDYAERGLERLMRNQPAGAILEEVYADQPKVLERIAVYRERVASITSEYDGLINTIDFEPIGMSSEIKDDSLMFEYVSRIKAAMSDTSRVEVAQADQ